MNLSIEKKEELMRLVMQEVEEAINEGNSPFGAILIDENGNVIEKAHNTAKSVLNPILHAEINLISKACKKLNTMDLSRYCIMSNAWSCSMCMSACIKAKIQNYIYGAPSEETMNPNVTIFDIKDKSKTELNIEIGILENECRLQIDNARKKDLN
jgi:tRNA(Arg) A34 adenosine deaminase TadA